ncbi:hypothetical protein TL16_g00446 [Triparma laevis f. inornata]|uniref:Elongation of fatty acids protein n=2 Tax=Triparma laevis TaxID=1534972 RepID=A0A9W6ZD73_9STRA|nr:hypothetical protein TL16_g00446 [Triparma laevis f. inornata]GMH50051.1 hypothetical protein TrLO_g5076 [Triparma laevis f. longispina]
MAKYYNVRGVEIEQAFQKMPFLEPFYSEFEKNYDVDDWHQWSKTTWPHVPLALCAIYLIAIFGGKYYMQDKKPAGDTNRSILAVWNFILSTFSFMGMARTVPHLLHNVFNKSIEENVCGQAHADWGSMATGFWVQLFIYSKPFELIDTYFIVARKRPLIFLHWYHHVTVLLFCWHSYAFESATGLFFVGMNYSVHAIMYGYYFLMAIKMKPKWMNPLFITVAQIMQMVVGVAVCLASYYYKNAGNCSVTNDNLIAGTVMYGSYFALFAKFAVDRYLGKAGMSTGMEKNKKKKVQ